MMVFTQEQKELLKRYASRKRFNAILLKEKARMEELQRLRELDVANKTEFDKESNPVFLTMIAEQEQYENMKKFAKAVDEMKESITKGLLPALGNVNQACSNLMKALLKGETQ